jgi:hypothetical protein
MRAIQIVSFHRLLLPFPLGLAMIQELRETLPFDRYFQAQLEQAHLKLSVASTRSVWAELINPKRRIRSNSHRSSFMNWTLLELRDYSVGS